MTLDTHFDNPTIRWAFYIDSGIDLDEEGRPVLEGHILQPNLIHVAVWCPWCQKPHRHGAGGPERVKALGLEAANGLRGAHCLDPHSPFRRDSYVVRAVGYADSAEYHKRQRKCVVCGKVRRSGPDQPYHTKCADQYWKRFGDLLVGEHS